MYLFAIFVALIGVALWGCSDLLWQLPHPYEAIPIQPVDDERNARLLAAVEAAKGKYAHIADKVPGRYIPLNGSRLTRLFDGEILGPESVAVSPTGRLTMLDRQGYVHHALEVPGKGFQRQLENPPFYIGPGRPLGYHYKGNDTLIVCDVLKGLTEVNLADRSIRILTNSIDGKPINYANDLDLSSDGEWVYFSSSTRGVAPYSPLDFYDTMRGFLLNMYSADITGRLLRYNFKTRVTELLLEGLWFSNGVALASDDEFVLVVETMGLRVIRHWLKGPKKGQTDVFIDALPGAPDGMTRAADGNFWLCLVVPLSPLFSFLEHALARLALAHLSITLGATKYFVKQWGCVLKISPSGEIIDVYLDPTGNSISSVSAVTEHSGRLYFGNLAGSYVSVFQL